MTKLRYSLYSVVLGLLFYGNVETIKNSENATSSQPSQNRTLNVEGIRPTKAILQQSASSTGTFHAEDQVLITAETAGYLDEILFREGEYVKTGQVIAQINNDQLQAEKNKLQVNLSYAQKQLARGKELLELEAISQEDFDALEHNVNALVADINLIDTRLDKTKIYAPFSGRLGVKSVSQGAYVSPGMAIVELFKSNPIKLEFLVPEKYIGKLKVGDEIKFTIPAQEDTFSTKIYLINPSMDVENRALSIRAKINNGSNAFVPGGYAEVYYSLGSEEANLLVPAEAIIPTLQGQKVLVAENGKVVSKPVEVGNRTSELVEITSGINENDVILVTGILAAGDGMDVNVQIKDNITK